MHLLDSSGPPHPPLTISCHKIITCKHWSSSHHHASAVYACAYSTTQSVSSIIRPSRSLSLHCLPSINYSKLRFGEERSVDVSDVSNCCNQIPSKPEAQVVIRSREKSVFTNSRKAHSRSFEDGATLATLLALQGRHQLQLDLRLGKSGNSNLLPLKPLTAQPKGRLIEKRSNTSCSLYRKTFSDTAVLQCVIARPTQWSSASSLPSLPNQNVQNATLPFVYRGDMMMRLMRLLCTRHLMIFPLHFLLRQSILSFPLQH